jgi:hypothetical protein
MHDSDFYFHSKPSTETKLIFFLALFGSGENLTIGSRNKVNLGHYSSLIVSIIVLIGRLITQTPHGYDTAGFVDGVFHLSVTCPNPVKSFL